MASATGWSSLVKSRILVKFILIGIVISIFCMVVSIFTTRMMREFFFREPFWERGPTGFIETLIEKVPPADRISVLQERPMRGPRVVDFYLTNEAGEIIFPTVNVGPEGERIPEIVANFKQGKIDVEDTPRFMVKFLKGHPPQYFVRVLHPRPPPPPPNDRNFIFMNLIQVLTIIIAVIVTLLFLVYSLRSRARLADKVIKDLTGGNLKARFPITKMDEVGHIMFSFNKMADQIEHLVEYLKKIESSRRDLLRELAHDLRTPIASMKSLIETVKDHSDQLSKEKRNELLELAMVESTYFEGLVNDLLFLGEVIEPSYREKLSDVNISDVITQEAETISHRYKDVSFNISGDSNVFLPADSRLIKRLIRNVLENSFSFSRSTVSVEVHVNGNRINIKIIDDGPGFSSDALENFGKRKYSRSITDTSKRISIGLGSVIMKSVVDAYGGDLTPTNITDKYGKIVGAMVSVSLPRS